MLGIWGWWSVNKDNLIRGVPAASGEEPLNGGRMTAGVVRIGETVRRQHKTTDMNVRKLLEHFEARGFPGAPNTLELTKLVD